METNDITGIIVDSALHVHKGLGPGLLESGLWDRTGAPLDGMRVACGAAEARFLRVRWTPLRRGIRTDLLVERRVVVELNSVEAMAPVHAKQSLTYLRLLDPRYGLLINFGAAYLKQGIKRVVNGYG